eukprot:gene27637-33375_t
MQQSFSMPNLPGMIPNRRSWVYREKEGFKKSTSRPGTANAASRPLSPSYARSDIFNYQPDEQQRPATAGPSSRPMQGLRGLQTLNPNNSQQFMQGLNDPNTQVLVLGMPGNSHSVNLLSRPQTASATMSRPVSAAKLPRYVETDKQVARFFGYFYEARPWDHEGPLGESLIETHVCRPIVLHYYIYDDTIEINEPRVLNSGLPQGNFLKRGKVCKDTDGSELTLVDLAVGNKVHILGQEIVITDADNFTRQYFKQELNMVLPPPLGTPPPLQADIAAQYATGLGPPLPSLHNKSFNTRSTGYMATKEQLDKTQMFLKYEGQVLRFLCVEVSTSSPPFFPALEEKLAMEGQDIFAISNGHGFIASATAKRYAFSYYLAHGTMDLIVQKKKGERDQGMDLPNTVLKKTQMPKNWRLVQSHRHSPVYYNVEDFVCGTVLDIYGRYFLLCVCDSFTQRMYGQIGIQQKQVTMIEEEVEKIVQPVPEAGDGFLAIGSNEDTLATVYGMPKPRKNVAKIYKNTNRLLRAKAKLLTDHPIESTRVFLLTFFLEDDSLQVYEDNVRNSGIWGGTFLKRGRYNHETPPDCPHPRPLLPTDIYLGNVVCVNGNQFRIFEMDNMSLKFCENYPDEFPMSDTFRIVGLIMLRVVEQQKDIRKVFQQVDSSHTGYLPQDVFIQTLDNLGLIEDLNDQEILTLMRRFQDHVHAPSLGGGLSQSLSAPSIANAHAYNGQGNARTQGNVFVYYAELCDLVSHVYFQHQSTTISQTLQREQGGANVYADSTPRRSMHMGLSTFGAFSAAARGRTTAWRRCLRKEPHTLPGKVTLAVLVQVFAKYGLVLDDVVIQDISRRYRVPDDLAQKELKELTQRHANDSIYLGLDEKVQPKAKGRTSKAQKKLLDSRAIAAKLAEMRKKTSATPSLFRRSSATDSYASQESDGDRFNMARILIDYNLLCDDVYVCDWLFA